MDKTNTTNILQQLDELLSNHRVSYSVVTHGLLEKLRSDSGEYIPDSLASEIRGLFGGMGSLNDVYISKLNGHSVDDEAKANKRLGELTAALWREVKR